MKIRLILSCIILFSTTTFLFGNKNTDEQITHLISKMTLEEKVSQLLNDSPAIERLGIPAYNWWNEALHGVARFGRATVFPQAIGMAAAFDDDLMFRVASAISDEARAKFDAAQAIGNNINRYTGLSFWTPNINIFRDPRWGRGMETYGEDPYLTGRLGVAFVKGMQGDHPKYLKTAACAKHYAVHSGPEADRHFFNAEPTKFDLYNTYLPAFNALVKQGNVEAVMCAYNSTYGEPCCGSEFLLQDILRNKWGFKGHILSDCWAVTDFHTGHKVTANAAESASLALKSGVSLNCGDSYIYLTQAVKQGLVTEKEIDDNLAILYKTRFKLGILGDAEDNPYKDISPSVVESEAHLALAHEAALKSIVLLKNKNNVLPLKKDLKQLFITGPTAADVDALLGNYHGQASQMSTIIEGLAQKVNIGTSFEYRRGFMLDRDNINKMGWAINEAHSSEVTIVVMGLSTILEGEEGEAIASAHRSDRQTIKLPPNQIEYLKKIRDNDGKPLIVVLTGGSPIAIQEVYELADAVLYVWYPGQKGGEAVADILFGDAAPSGKLPITFPMSVEQLPAYANYDMKGRTYRYMDSEPLFPFGFGLSYTQFEYSDLTLSKSKINKGQSIEINVKVTNKGKYTAEEVVQLYIKDVEASRPVPNISLKNFKRIQLNAGESKTVNFEISPDDLSFYNEDGQLELESGAFEIYVGGSVPSERSLALGASLYVMKQLNVR